MAQYQDSNIIVRTGGGRNTFLIFLLILVIAALVALYYFYGNKPSSEKPETETTTQTYDAPRPTAARGDDNYEFDDGLGTPDSSTRYQLDEFGEGIAHAEVFNIDINRDGTRDKITRRRIETGTDHFYFEYKIELNMDGKMTDITPAGFRTTEGAECALQKLRFVFKPEFKVTKISRDWRESWVTPTMAVETVYRLENNQIQPITSRRLKEVCNVSDLF